MRWYVMRDLKRANAKVPAYKLLEGMKMEVFVPMKWHLVTRKGIRVLKRNGGIYKERKRNEVVRNARLEKGKRQSTRL